MRQASPTQTPPFPDGNMETRGLVKYQAMEIFSILKPVF